MEALSGSSPPGGLERLSGEEWQPALALLRLLTLLCFPPIEPARSGVQPPDPPSTSPARALGRFSPYVVVRLVGMGSRVRVPCHVDASSSTFI